METVNQSVLDKARLSTLASSNETAAAIFKDAAERQRISWETNLARYAVKLAHKGFKVVDEDFEKTWKALEDMGAGVIVRGRNGNADRFKWYYSLKEIGVGGLNPDQVGDIKKTEESVEDKPKRKYTRRKFNRTAFMKKMWAEGKIKGRGHKKLGRPKKTPQDIQETILKISQDLQALARKFAKAA